MGNQDKKSSKTIRQPSLRTAYVKEANGKVYFKIHYQTYDRTWYEVKVKIPRKHFKEM